MKKEENSMLEEYLLIRSILDRGMHYAVVVGYEEQHIDHYRPAK